jgi:hypothetical protein
MYDKVLIFRNTFLYNKYALLAFIMIAWWEEIIGFITLALISLALFFAVCPDPTTSTLSFHGVFYF